MKCPNCMHKFLSASALVVHLKYVHPNINCFSCTGKNCDRRFQNIRMYKKHLILKHKFESKYKNLITNTANDSTSCNSCINTDVPPQKIAKLESQKTNILATLKAENIDNSPKIPFDVAVSNIAGSFVTTLYNFKDLSRSVVQKLIEYFEKMLRDLLHLLQLEISIVLQNCLPIVKNEIVFLVNSLKGIFKDLGTEYLRLKYFRRSSAYILPKPYIIGSNTINKKKQNLVTLDVKRFEGCFIPMRQVLKCFFEVPGVLQIVRNYRNTILESRTPDTFSHFMQGELWQNRMVNFPEKMVLPIIVYYDDFEICNPLGSHAVYYKLGAVYFTVACLPPEYASQLQNIFLAMLFYAGDRVTFGNRATFSPLLQELHFLEAEGIDIEVDNESVRLYFSLCLVVGDNLGLNSILGYTESFSTNYFCRYCHADKQTSQSLDMEDLTLLRTVDSYQNDVETYSHGIKELCIFNELENYHVIENVCFDIMHDLLEGICRYDMAHFINHFLEKEYFTLEFLNDRTRFYNFSSREKNLPPPIRLSNLRNGYIIMSSAEMLAFVRNFSLIIGDVVPEDDEVWKLYLILLEIMSIIMSSTISKPQLNYLKYLISEHHSRYISLFNDSLKPKHHFLIHYPTIISNVGPLLPLWCMRFEANHKSFKTYSHIITSKRNIPYTLSVKNQLNMCLQLLSDSSMQFKTHIELILY